MAVGSELKYLEVSHHLANELNADSITFLITASIEFYLQHAQHQLL
jgi:hypothetical protein